MGEVRTRPEEAGFVEKAKAFTSHAGGEAVLLLVGSRAAGLDDSWSDLDMWVVGDKTCLCKSERDQYEKDGQLFIDRGDYEAHWSFYDLRDLLSLLSTCPDERMWILRTAEVMSGSEDTASILRHKCSRYPEDILEQKLKLHFGHFWQCLGPLNTAARGMPETAFLVAAKTIEHLCKICCLAERKPFPYTKWLIPVARETILGRKVALSIARAVFGIEEFLHPPSGKHFQELTPLRELRSTKDVVREALKELGWTSSWIDNPEEAVAESLQEHTERLEASR